MDGFKLYGLFVGCWHHGAYGVWTIIYIVVYFKSNTYCGEVSSFSKLNYYFIIIFGIPSAVYSIIFGIALVLVIIPYICIVARR